MTDEEKLEALDFHFRGSGHDGAEEGYYRGDESIHLDSGDFKYVFAFENPIVGKGPTLKAMVEDAKKSLKSIYRAEMNNLKLLEKEIDSLEQNGDAE